MQVHKITSQATKMQVELDVSGRDLRFDILRAMALFCVVLAHVEPPDWIFQLRNFDVPCLVIVSGASFGLSALKQSFTVLGYIKKRILRLLVPTWTFLFLFFTINSAVTFFAKEGHSFSVQKIIRSFALLQGGFAGVWIIRVFVLMVISGPILVKIKNILKNNFIFFVFLSIIYGFYELIYYKDICGFLFSFSPCIKFVVENYVFYLLPYSFLFGLGLCLPELSRRFTLSIFSITFIIFCCSAFLLSGNNSFNCFAWTQQYKYPPRLYYLTYAISFTLLLYCILFNHKSYRFNTLFSKILVFVNISSLWIFFWHRVLNFLWDASSSSLPTWSRNFIIRFTVLIIFSIAFTFVQRCLIKKIITNNQTNLTLNRFLSLMFL
jgi:hypothetical protein